MDIKQIYAFTNSAVKEALGETDLVVAEDLSNVVDIGTAVFNANAQDAYVRALTNHIGRVIFVNRKYQGRAPSVMMDDWEFGSVLEKIRAELPEATENKSWDLQDGVSYDPHIFHKPNVSAKFYNMMSTLEIDQSITELQVKQSFSNVAQLNSFLSMLYNKVDDAFTLRADELVMRTIDNMIGETIIDDYGSDTLASKSGIKAVNLLYLYNQLNAGATLTASNCIYNPEFIRFASYQMKMYADRLKSYSKLFNVGKTAKHTSIEFLKIVMLSNFKSAADVYLQSDTFHDEFTKLPQADSISYWQGTGTSYAFEDVSKIDIKTSSGTNVAASGVLAVMFDRDALGVNCYNRRTTTSYNAKAEFYNNFHKMDARYFNDLDENFVVFFVA